MTVPSFPTLIGMSFPIVKKPTMDSIVASNQSAREVRFQNYAYPLYQWEVNFQGLTNLLSGSAASALGAASFQALAGFFLSLGGQWSTFTFTDATDSAVTNQFIATGDATTKTFPLVRTIGGFTEPISWLNSASSVEVGGIAQPTTSWTAVTPNTLTFVSAPASGSAITASLSYSWMCRMNTDQLDFNEFFGAIWELKKMTFQQVRTS